MQPIIHIDDIWFKDEAGRTLAGLVRPYARKTAGRPQRMRWDLATRTFEFTWQPGPAIDAPTEIFVPAVQYPGGYRVELSAGSYRQEPKSFCLLIEAAGQRHRRAHSGFRSGCGRVARRRRICYIGRVNA